MEKTVRPLLLVGLMAIVLLMGKSEWIKFREKTASERYSYQSYKQATDYFRKLLKVLPFAAAHHVLADSYLDEGLEDQAVEEYNKTLQMDERRAPAYLALANIYLQRGFLKEAMELLQKAEGVIPDNHDIKDLEKRASFEYFSNTGVKAFERGDRLKARELLNNALEANPNSALIHYLLALSFDERQDFYRVEDYLKEAIDLDPKFYLAHSFLGDVYFGKGDFEAAIEQYQLSLTIRHDNPSILNNMGLAYMNLEKYDAAILQLEKASTLAPVNIGIRHNLAATYRDYGMLDKAVEGFISIIQIEPGYPDVHNDLGDIYKKQGRNQEAFKEYQASIEYGQKRLSQSFRDPLLLIELAHAYNEIKEYDKAKKLIDEALFVNPGDSKAYLTLADTYKGFNHPDAALVALEEAKKLSPKEYSFIEKAIADTKEQILRSKQ
ncbi:MAG: tetratricopeptide repeat protein [Candidatus Omnitrophota bacterium]